MSEAAFNDTLGLRPNAEPWENFTRWVKLCVVFSQLINGLVEHSQANESSGIGKLTEDEVWLLARVQVWVSNNPDWQWKRDGLQPLWNASETRKIPSLHRDQLSLAWDALDGYRRQNGSLQLVQQSLVRQFATKDSETATKELLQHFWNAMPPCLMFDRQTLEHQMAVPA